MKELLFGDRPDFDGDIYLQLALVSFWYYIMVISIYSPLHQFARFYSGDRIC
jgi:hypothetical protein